MQHFKLNPEAEMNLRCGGEEKPAVERIRGTDAVEVR